ncbi:RDD family protein [Oerskovia turbata]
MGDTATATHTPHHDEYDLLDRVDVPPLGAYASWSRRVVAFLLDNAILAGVMFVAVGPGLPPSMLPGLENTRATAGGLGWSENAWMIAAVLAMALLQSYTGATPGKRVVGIVVVNRDSGRPVGLLTTVLRWLAHLLDAILFLGYLRPLWETERRTFADSLLSTVVVTSRSPEPHPWVAPFQREGRPGAKAVTAAAVLVSVAGALFTFGPTNYTGGSVATSVACTSWDNTPHPDAPLFAEASFSTTTPGTVTRWGMTHPVPSTAEGSEITLTWEGDLPLDADVVLEAVLVSPDSAERLEYSTPLDTGTGFGAPPVSPGVVDIPGNDLRDVEHGWTWSVRMRIDGVATPSCGETVPY